MKVNDVCKEKRCRQHDNVVYRDEGEAQFYTYSFFLISVVSLSTSCSSESLLLGSNPFTRGVTIEARAMDLSTTSGHDMSRRL